MKRTIILAISFVCLFAHNTFSQQPYRTFKQCDNDIKKYLKYNFKDRVGNNQLYQGKTFAQLMSDLEIKPLGFARVIKSSSGNDSYLAGIYLFFTCYNGVEYSEPKDEYLAIGFETPILHSSSATREKARLSPPIKGQKKYDSPSDLVDVYPENKWVSQHYNFFKDQKIEAINYSPVRF